MIPHLGGDVLEGRLGTRGGELDGRGIDVVVEPVGHLQTHAVALVGVDIGVAIAAHDVVTGAAGPGRFGLRVGLGLDAMQQALALLPLEVDVLLVDVWGWLAAGAGGFVGWSTCLVCSVARRRGTAWGRRGRAATTARRGRGSAGSGRWPRA